RVESAVTRCLSETAGQSAARPSGHHRPTFRVGPAGVVAVTGDAVRSLRETSDTCQFAVAGALSRQRLFRAGRVWTPRSDGERLGAGSRHLLWNTRDCPAS